jgi:hypothetical protein
LKVEKTKTPSLFSEKIKEDLNKLQELTQEANKIMSEKLSKPNNEQESPEMLITKKIMSDQNKYNGPLMTQDNKEQDQELLNDKISMLQNSIKNIPSEEVKKNLISNRISLPDDSMIKNNLNNVIIFYNN